MSDYTLCEDCGKSARFEGSEEAYLCDSCFLERKREVFK